MMAGLPRLTNGQGQIPDAEYWFAPQRRSETVAFLSSHSCWLGCLTVAVIYGVHTSILRANATTPATLAFGQFFTMIGLYLAGLAWLLMRLLRHFQRPTNRTI